jgi:hypothetical protein
MRGRRDGGFMDFSPNSCQIVRHSRREFEYNSISVSAVHRGRTKEVAIIIEDDAPLREASVVAAGETIERVVRPSAVSSSWAQLIDFTTPARAGAPHKRGKIVLSIAA